MLVSGLPLVTRLLSSRGITANSYSLLETINPFLTLDRLATPGPAPADAPWVTLQVLLAALVILLLNMRSVVFELQHHRIALPARVIEEELALHPPPLPKPSNPWEQD